MLLTKATLQGLQVSFSSIHAKGWAMAEPRLIQMATVVPSSTRTNTYGWMAKLMKLRKWEGPRLIQNLSTHTYTLENEPWELTVGVDKFDIRDDMLGIYNPLFEELGRQAKLWPDTVLKTALQAGTTLLGFDGVAFFATTHPLNPAGNQSNNFAATALSAANFAIVRAAMMSYTDETGEPLGVMPDTLFVPPGLVDTANTIVTAEFGASGVSNIQRGQARVVMVPQLANQATTWYLADTSTAIKPLVWQLRDPPLLVSKTNPNEDPAFWDKQLIWGIEARGAAGYGPWFLAARAIAT